VVFGSEALIIAHLNIESNDSKLKQTAAHTEIFTTIMHIKMKYHKSKK